jgi:hypothetical protein
MYIRSLPEWIVGGVAYASFVSRHAKLIYIIAIYVVESPFSTFSVKVDKLSAFLSLCLVEFMHHSSG